MDVAVQSATGELTHPCQCLWWCPCRDSHRGQPQFRVDPRKHSQPQCCPPPRRGERASLATFHRIKESLTQGTGSPKAPPPSPSPESKLASVPGADALVSWTEAKPHWAKALLVPGTGPGLSLASLISHAGRLICITDLFPSLLLSAGNGARGWPCSAGWDKSAEGESSL